MPRARDIELGEEVYIGDLLVERATDELYEACWSKSIPKGKVAFYTVVSDEGNHFQLEWYLVPTNERTQKR